MAAPSIFAAAYCCYLCGSHISRLDVDASSCLRRGLHKFMGSGRQMTVKGTTSPCSGEGARFPLFLSLPLGLDDIVASIHGIHVHDTANPSS